MTSGYEDEMQQKFSRDGRALIGWRGILVALHQRDKGSLADDESEIRLFA
jgi:hypothetical protein